jgi:hypothetical protein
LAHQKQAEGVLDVGIARVDRHRLAQQFGPLLVHAAQPVKVG